MKIKINKNEYFFFIINNINLSFFVVINIIIIKKN